MDTKTETIDQYHTNKGLILEIQKLSTEDGPGIRTSIFFKGCPLKCIWCHNPESIPSKPGIQWFKVKCIGDGTCVEVCSEEALDLDELGVHINREKCTICGKCAEECPSTALMIFGKEWSVEELFHEVEKDKSYYEKSGGGITVSGGEPLLQVQFIVTFLRICKENGLSTALDTCGYASLQNFEKLIPYIDLILFDLKEIDPKKHEEYTGVSNKQILENIRWLVKNNKQLGKKIWIRTPIIPEYTATKENIRGLAQFIVNELDNKIHRWDLLAFNNLAIDKYDRMGICWELKNTPLLRKEEMEFYYKIANEEGVKNVHWSGMTQTEEIEEENQEKKLDSRM